MHGGQALSVVLTSGAILLLVWAALHDLAARTVPNLLPACIAGLGVCVRLLDHSLVPALSVAAIIFALLFFCWRLGAIGGGDVKLWSASVLLVPPQLQAEFSCLTRILLIGGALALLYLALRPCIARPRSGAAGKFRRVLRAEAWRIRRKAPLPYAFAIAGGTIATLALR